MVPPSTFGTGVGVQDTLFMSAVKVIVAPSSLNGITVTVPLSSASISTVRSTTSSGFKAFSRLSLSTSILLLSVLGISYVLPFDIIVPE